MVSELENKFDLSLYIYTHTQNIYREIKMYRYKEKSWKI